MELETAVFSFFFISVSLYSFMHHWCIRPFLLNTSFETADLSEMDLELGEGKKNLQQKES